jgi:hypothetical protein
MPAFLGEPAPPDHPIYSGSSVGPRVSPWPSTTSTEASSPELEDEIEAQETEDEGTPPPELPEQE